MNPELESQAREVLAKVLARDDFPAVLVDPVSTYLVTGKVQDMSVHAVYDAISPRHYTGIYWLLYYLGHNGVSDVKHYLRQANLHYPMHDS